MHIKKHRIGSKGQELFLVVLVAALAVAMVPIGMANSAGAEMSQTPELSSGTPGIELGSPPDGAATVNHAIPFGWHSAVAAQKCLLQVDNNPDFSSPEIEASTTDRYYAPTKALSDGTYYWRVKEANEDSEGKWSEIWRITIFTVVELVAAEFEIMTSNDVGVVPQWQHKDTMMLCLGGCPLYGTHAWDNDHISYDSSCIHCYTYCARASISMINHYYGGNLHQDTISHHAFGEGDPEDDLDGSDIYGHSGMYIEENNALAWALNGGTDNWMIMGKPTYAQIQEWIDEGRPILAITGEMGQHALVIDGYDTNGTLINVVEPKTNSESQFDYSTYVIHRVYVPPAGSVGRNEEDLDSDGVPDVLDDSDGDGMCDYDERNRFFTDPNDADTDDDLVPDKAEVRSYTFLSDDSFDAGDTRKPDPDGDGLRAELDTDSDNGGVADGDEDLNRNGIVDPGETDPLDPSDDFWAVLELLPNSKNNKAGRTIPVKFSLRIAAAVDPAQPFVYDEELEIRIYDGAGNPSQISVYGDTARDYRIDTEGEKYITNFRTGKKPAEYTVEIWRISTSFMIGSFTFETTK